MSRSTAVGFFQTVEMSSAFVLTKMKPILMETLDIHGMFAMFASKIFYKLLFKDLKSLSTFNF